MDRLEPRPDVVTIAPVWAWMRISSVPYLSVIAIATVLSPYVTYLVRDDIRIKGQPLYIACELLLVPVALILWWLYRGSASPNRSVRWLLATAFAAWAVRMGLMVVHGDQFNHLVWVTPLVLIMLWLKTPTWQDARAGVVVLAYALATMLLTAYLLEVTGLYEPLYLPEEITAFQQREYWLPLDGLPGIEGRWTGPLGHNTRTGLAAALVLTIGVARWSKTSVYLVLVGGFFLLATSVRASYLAALAGIAIVVLFSRWRRMSRVPALVRWGVLAALVVVAGTGMLVTGAGLTGRDTIWPAFARLIPQSPIIGIGATGIRDEGGKVALSGDAHNIVLDEIIRFGVVGSIVLFAFFAVVVWLSFAAANRGFTLGSAIIATYLVASLTDVQNSWLELSYHSFLVLLGALAAGLWLGSREPGTSNNLRQFKT